MDTIKNNKGSFAVVSLAGKCQKMNIDDLKGLLRKEMKIK